MGCSYAGHTPDSPLSGRSDFNPQRKSTGRRASKVFFTLLFSFENTVSKKYKKKHTNTQKCRPKDRISKKKTLTRAFNRVKTNKHVQYIDVPPQHVTPVCVMTLSLLVVVSDEL